MKKLLLASALLCFCSANSFSQTFSFTTGDTIKYGAPATIFGCTDTFINNSAVGYYIDVVRVVNDTAPGWQTSFCVDVCYPPFVDSARFYILPSGTQKFLLDFVASPTPDSSTALMKFVNVSNPSNTIYQRFYGITQATFGINALSAQSVNAFFYPSPATANSTVTLRIAGNSNADFTLQVFDLQGRMVARKENLTAGNNALAFSFPAGMYVYSILQDNGAVSTGKLVVTE